jgi:phosphoserine phosphatase RsbU/P
MQDHDALEVRLRDIQMIIDAALSHQTDQDFLTELLDRTRDILNADTAAVLLLDRGQLVAAAAAGLEEEVRHGVRVPIGKGFAGRIAAEGKPVILDYVVKQQWSIRCCGERPFSRWSGCL